jgi:hypothetical protein
MHVPEYFPFLLAIFGFLLIASHAHHSFNSTIYSFKQITRTILPTTDEQMFISMLLSGNV